MVGVDKWTLLFLCFFSVVGGYNPPVYFLDQECEQSVSVSKDMILRLTENDTESSASEWSCVCTVEATELHSRLLITPLQLNIKQQSQCKDNALYITDSDGHPLNNPPPICKDHLSSSTLNTSGSYAWFRFEKKEDVTDIGSFELLVTVFTEPKNDSCKTGLFHCQNNNCVSSEVVCNGYDDCGDGTDERHCFFSHVALTLICVTGVLLVFSAIVVFIVVKFKKAKSEYVAIQ